jgi:hypothetical protein
MIQGWYDEYCRVYGKESVQLEIAEEHEQIQGAYKVTNPRTGACAPLFWSTVSDCDKFEGTGIPGDLIGGIWEVFNDLG